VREIDSVHRQGKTGPVKEGRLQQEFESWCWEAERQAAWLARFRRWIGRLCDKETIMKKPEFHKETDAVRGGTSCTKRTGAGDSDDQKSTCELTDSQEQVRATVHRPVILRLREPTHTW